MQAGEHEAELGGAEEVGSCCRKAAAGAEGGGGDMNETIQLADRILVKEREGIEGVVA